MLAIGRSKKSVLGVALGDRAALVAEVTCSGSVRQVTRAGEFAYPTGANLDGGELGAALKPFLRERGFTASRAVFGVPAKWLVSKSYTVPPADPASASAILKLRAEADGASELGELVLDFVGEISSTKASTALVFGLPRQRLERLQKVARAADLELAAVTPCATALGSATAAIAEHSLVLAVRRDGTELALQDGSRTLLVRHLTSAVGGAPLVSELRRALAVLPTESGDAEPPRRHLVVWDDGSLDDQTVEQIRAAAGAPVVRGSLQTLCRNGLGSASANVGACAVAVALSALNGSRPAVDFLRPRIVARRRKLVPMRAVAVLGAAAAVAIAVLLYADLAKIRRDAVTVERELRQIDPSFKLAQSFVSDMQFVDSFGDNDPHYLSCLRDVTAALPDGGQTYLTRFHLKTNMTGEISGRAPGGRDVLNLLERLNAGGQFVDLRRRIDARGNGPDVTFLVTFKYVGR